MSISVEQAYPNIQFRHSVSLLKRLDGIKAECIHLQSKKEWSACYSPDTAVRNGKSVTARAGASRPEVQLCRDCLGGTLLYELPRFRGRVVAFDPAPGFTQYFFAAEPDFDKSSIDEGVQYALSARVAGISGACQSCSRDATWLWLDRRDVLDCEDVEGIKNASGALLCASHGARIVIETFSQIDHADLEYVNLPYGESGAYFWI